MKRTSVQLAPGVRLLTLRTNQFKTNLFSVTLAVPLARETASANALIPEVLYRGTSRCPDIERLSAEADRLYGASIGVGIRRRGEMQCVTLRCAAADDRFVPGETGLLEQSVALLGELLLDPATENGLFRADYVRGEGANLADRIRAERSDKIAWANWRLIQEMCRDEAFSIHKLGTAEEAERAEPAALWAAYQALLAQAQVIFCCCGPAEPERVEAAVRTSFAPLLGGAREGGFLCTVRPEPAGPVRRVTEWADAAQCKLALGFRTGGVTEADSRYPAMVLCSAMYGGTSHSKLFLNVRERLSLCYYADSAYDRLKGILLVSTGVERDRLDAAEREIMAQLAAMARGEFTAEEQALAVRALCSGLIAGKDCQGRLEDGAVTGFLTRGAFPDTDGLIAALEAVTAEQIVEAAGLIRPDTVYCLRGREED